MLLLLTLVTAAALALAILGFITYFAILLLAEEERGDSLLPLSVVIMTLTHACFIVLLVPLDAACWTGDHSISLLPLWGVALALLMWLAFVTAPFAMAYYESWSPAEGSVWRQLRNATLLSLLSAAVATTLVAVLWIYTGYYVDPVTAPAGPPVVSRGPLVSRTRAPLIVYVFGLLSNVGWAMLLPFGGAGLAATPVALLAQFARRPRAVNATQYATARSTLHSRSAALLDACRRLDTELTASTAGGATPNVKQRGKARMLQRDARELEIEYVKLEAAFHLSGRTILYYYGVAAAGCVCALLSIVWAVQVVLSAVLRVSPGLDIVLQNLDYIPFASTGLYACLSLYLLTCVVVGCWRVAAAASCLPGLLVFRMHAGAMMANAMVYNTVVCALSAPAVVQLCVVCFKQYSARTVVAELVLRGVEKLAYLRFAGVCAPYALMPVAVIALALVLFRPLPSTDGLEDDGT